MNSARLRDLVGTLNEKRVSLIVDRGREYAKDSDQLSSFKEIASIWNILHPDKELKASNVAELLVILKFIRSVNLSRQDPNTETPQRYDTIVDWHNYIDLMMGCQMDEREL